MKTISIDNLVFERMTRLARQSAIRFDGAECGGFLLSDGNGIVQMIVPEQVVDAYSCNLSRGFREACIAAYKSGLSLSGMWHSHAGHSLFHSSDDYSCISNFLGIIRQCNNSFGKWNAFAIGEDSIGLFNMHRGYEVKMNKTQNPQGFIGGILGMREALQENLFSIVINHETYGSPSVQGAASFGKYHAIIAQYGRNGNNPLVSEKASIMLTSDYCEGIEKLCREDYPAAADSAYPAMAKSRDESQNKGQDKSQDKSQKIYSVSGNKLKIGSLEVMLGNCSSADAVESITELSPENLEKCKKELIEQGEKEGKKLRQCRIEGMLCENYSENPDDSGRDCCNTAQFSGNAISIPASAGFYESARKAYESFKAGCRNFAPFYLRESGIAKIIQYADSLLLKIFSEIAEAPKCENCGWEAKLKNIESAYSEFRKYDILGECYIPLLDKVKSLLENCPMPKNQEKSAKRLCKKISRKPFLQRVSDCIECVTGLFSNKKSNNQNKSNNAGRARKDKRAGKNCKNGNLQGNN